MNHIGTSVGKIWNISAQKNCSCLRVIYKLICIFTLLDIFPTALLRKNKHCYHQSEKISTSREEIVNKEQVSLHSCALIKWLNSTFFVCFFKNNENSTVDQKWSIID